MAPEQPLEFTESTNHHQAKRLRFNLRKLSELPFHLVKSRRITDLKQEVLFNYKWLITKLQAMSLHDILSDFRFAIDSGFQEEEIQLLANTLRISGSHLKEKPHALAYELTGRLLPYYDQYRHVKSLLQQCDTVALSDTCFVPLIQCFEAPRGMLTYILEDHREIVYDLIFSKSSRELVSISRDNTIAFWDMNTGDRTRLIDVSDLHSGSNTRLHQSNDGRYLVCDSDAINSPAYIFDMKLGQLIHKVGKRSTTQKRCFVVGRLLLRQKTIIDIEKGEEIGTIDDYVASKKYLTCGITPNTKYILLGDERETGMYDIRTRKRIVSFPGQHMPCLFVFTSDSSLCYTGYNEDCLFKIFDIDPQSNTFGHTKLIYNYLSAFPELRHMDAPIYANELSSIALSPQDETKVLISIKRCQLIMLDIHKQTSKLVDMSVVSSNERTFIMHARLSSDGKFIMAAAGTYMYIWESEQPRFLTTVNIHSIERFPVTVSTHRNLVATASTLHTAIKIWDLDKIYVTKATQLNVYMNPTDTLACSHAHRLLFVKKYHRHNYKFMDYFGIDVWNISTGTVSTCLASGQYGELIKMAASRDGHHMALLISNRQHSYVCVISLKLNKVLAFHRHAGCSDFVVNHTTDLIATEARLGDVRDVKLWSYKGGELARFEDASSPVFTSDGEYLVYVESMKSIELFCLKTMQGVNSMLCDVNKLSRIPTMHQYILATTFPQRNNNVSVDQSDKFAQVSLWHITAGFMISQFARVAPSGMKDFSKEGRICIDALLQVFDIKSGKLLSRLSSASSAEFAMVRLTYDGQYAIWAHELSINVARVSDSQLVGLICTHEKPVSLKMLDFGYTVIIGREDGHILTAKIVDGESSLPPNFRPQTAKERLNAILEKVIYPDGIIAILEPYYQLKPKAISDSALPKLCKDIQSSLKEKARVPHAVIKTVYKTSSFGDLKEFEKEFKRRRGSSPAIHLMEQPPDIDISNLDNGHGAGSSRSRKHILKSPHSMTEFFTYHTTGRPKSREKSPSVSEIFSTQRSVPHASSILVALSDFSGKMFKRKSSENATSVTSSPMPARKPVQSHSCARGSPTNPKILSPKSHSSPKSPKSKCNVKSKPPKNPSHGAQGVTQRKPPVTSASLDDATDVTSRKEIGRSRFYSTTDVQQTDEAAEPESCDTRL